MPKPSTVTAPAELLTYCFSAWPEVKKTQMRSWLKHQAITVNGRPISQFNHPLQPGDVVAVRHDRFAAPKTVLGGGLKIYHEDADVIVIEKPSGLLSIASEAEQEKTAYRLLTEHVRRGNPLGKERVWIVHRLDRETSGLMVFAKTREAKEFLQSGWERATKIYEAVVEGHLPAEAGTLESDLDESNPYKVFSVRRNANTRHAVTHYRVLAQDPRRSLVELTLETGRRHQIRVQLAEAGCPILGDKKYGARTNPAHRLALHSCALQFPHPRTGKNLRFTSPLPKELARQITRTETRDIRKPRDAERSRQEG
jgi:23S rRNA pseudouridine1911/1915/1917 synthase